MTRCAGRSDAAAQRQAIAAFNRGKSSGDGLRDTLQRLRGQRDENRRLIRACWRMARAQGQIGAREHELVLLWGKWLGWDAAEVAALDRAQPGARRLRPVGVALMNRPCSCWVCVLTPIRS